MCQKQFDNGHVAVPRSLVQGGPAVGILVVDIEVAGVGGEEELDFRGSTGHARLLKLVIHWEKERKEKKKEKKEKERRRRRRRKERSERRRRKRKRKEKGKKKKNEE